MAIAESILTKETAVELADYVKAAGVSDYVFRGETDKSHRQSHLAKRRPSQAPR